jgi:hypothetical protein
MRTVPGLVARWWPDPADEDLLRVAVGPVAGAADAWQRARRTFVLDQVTGPQLELVPMLWRRLTDAGVDDPDLPRMKGIHRRTWYLNRKRLAELAQLVEAFRTEGLPVLVLKGAALAPAYYHDVGLRPMGDVDVLVPRTAWEAALRLLQDRGWRRRISPTADVFGIGQAEPLDHASGSVLDLHWLVGWEFGLDGDATGAIEPFFAAAVPFDVVRGVPARTLCAADQLLHVCAHGTRAGGAAMVRGLADAATVINATPGPDWTRLVAQARRYHMTRTVYEVLTYLDQALQVGTPSSTRRALAASPVRLRDRLVFRARADPDALEPLIGGSSRTLTSYVVMTAGLPTARALRVLPEWLRVKADLDHAWQVPVRAARLGGRLARQRLAGARASS